MSSSSSKNDDMPPPSLRKTPKFQKPERIPELNFLTKPGYKKTAAMCEWEKQYEKSPEYAQEKHRSKEKGEKKPLPPLERLPELSNALIAKVEKNGGKIPNHIFSLFQPSSFLSHEQLQEKNTEEEPLPSFAVAVTAKTDKTRAKAPNSTRASKRLATAEDYGQPKKPRTNDHLIRKKLFNDAPNGTTPPKTQTNRRTSHITRIHQKKTVIQKKSAKSTQSTANPDETMPLMSLNEAENKLGFGGFTFTAPLITITPTNTSKKSRTPISSEEFLQLEQKLQMESPMTEICGRLKNAKVTNAKPDDKLASLKSKYQQLQNEFHMFKTHFENKFRAALEEIENFERQLSEQDEENDKKRPNKPSKADKENFEVRRSPRLSSTAVLAVSPAMSKGRDLRVETLKKSLKKQAVADGGTPKSTKKIEDALVMYNSFRERCKVLSTPQLNRMNRMESPKSCTGKRSLSNKLQKQCLMLQETPFKG